MSKHCSFTYTTHCNNTKRFEHLQSYTLTLTMFQTKQHFVGQHDEPTVKSARENLSPAGEIPDIMDTN